MHPVKSFGTCSNGRMYGRRFIVGWVRGKRGVEVDLTCWQQVWVVLHRIQQVVRRADVTHPAVLHGLVTFVGFLSIVQVNTTKSSPPGHRDVKIDQLGIFSTTFKPPLPQPEFPIWIQVLQHLNAAGGQNLLEARMLEFYCRGQNPTVIGFW